MKSFNVLKETYCGKIGVEFMHLTDPDEKSWIQERIEEPHNKTEFTPMKAEKQFTNALSPPKGLKILG